MLLALQDRQVLLDLKELLEQILLSLDLLELRAQQAQLELQGLDQQVLLALLVQMDPLDLQGQQVG